MAYSKDTMEPFSYLCDKYVVFNYIIGKNREVDEWFDLEKTVINSMQETFSYVKKIISVFIC